LKRPLRVIALLVFAAAVAFWMIAGANRGWTTTTVPVKKLDEVTGIVGIEHQDRFVPGLDFLGAAGIAAGILVGCSFVVRGKPNPH
jgi:hypothetical protein